MRRPSTRGVAVALLLLLALPAAVQAEEVRSRDVYVRRRTTIPRAVQWLVSEARRVGVGQMLVVFDAASFAPPPGVTEFSAEYLYPDDLPAWLDALGNEVATAPCPIRATSSLAPKSIAVGSDRWREELEALVTRPWWDGDEISMLEPAVWWINRLLVRTEGAIGRVTGDSRRMLVLVTGSITPERWTFLGNRPAWESDWRTKLRPVGQYWDEEAVAARLDADGCRFYVVAPEAHFGDFRPFVELPQAPWASRPQFPPLRYTSRDDAPDGPQVTPPEFDEEEVRRRLDEQLKPTIPDPAERSRVVEAMLEQLRAAQETSPRARRDASRRRRRRPTTPGPRPATPGGGPEPLQATSWRFRSYTPYWFPRYDASVFYNNHAPSGYGYWPFARVAAKTGGKYFFYPFPPSRWLDVCPYEPALLDRLAPELIHTSKYLGRVRSDRAFDAVAKAANLVSDETPWADAHYDERTATAWSTFRRTAPLRFHPDWFLRRNPFEVVFEDGYGAREALHRTGSRIQEDVLPLYDEAIRLLDRAIAAEGEAGPRRSHPRAVADLVLSRYWFAMSAFHLDAFSTYALELERFIPERLRGRVDRIWVTYVPTIKMSDCLDAYDGRTLSLEDEAQYERWVLPDQPGQQGNILLIDGEHPDYRAQRSLGSVLRHLDPRLRRRALDMIFSARRVMADYAKSGWGWTTYYSIAYTFVFLPIPRSEGPRGSRPGGNEPPPPTTPRGPSTTPGGSSSGGPTTGR